MKMTMINSGLKGLNIDICKILVSNYFNMSYFHPLEVVGRGSETQRQMGEKIKYKI